MPKHWERDAKEQHGPVTTRKPTPEEQEQYRAQPPSVRPPEPLRDRRVRLAWLRDHVAWLQEREAEEPGEYRSYLDIFIAAKKALEAEIARGMRQETSES